MPIRRYGWSPSLPDHRDYRYRPTALALLAAPPHVDLSTSAPPVYDQGELGSCTANALAGLIQFDEVKQGLALAASKTPSRLMIYYDERAIEGTVGSDAGAAIRDGIKTLNTQGWCDETLWPYDVSRFVEQPPAACYAQSLPRRISEYAAVSQDADHIVACLAEGFPVVGGFTVYQSFESQAVAKSGMVPMPGRGERVLGGHAVGIFGYDLPRQLFLIRNSWGDGWGLKGYCWMPFAYWSNPNLASDLWTIRFAPVDVPTPPAPPAPPSPTPQPTPAPTPGPVPAPALTHTISVFSDGSIKVA